MAEEEPPLNKRRKGKEQEQEQEEAPLKRRKGKEPAVIADDPSKPKTTSVRLEYRKAFILRQCFDCLCDSKLNPEHVGMVEVTNNADDDDKSFQITVRNEYTQVVGCLLLVQSMFNHFHCLNPLLPHFISLDPIFNLLLNTTHNGRIKISQAPNQHSHLCFKSYSTTANHSGTPPKQLAAPLIKPKDDPERFRFPADIKPLCFAVIPSIYLREMLHYLAEANEAPLVLMVVRSGLVDIFVGQHDEWKLTRQEIACWTGPKPEEMQYDAYFVLPHAKSMRRALSLDPEPAIFFLRVPENHILMMFKFEGDGKLAFLSKVIRMDSKKNIMPAAAAAGDVVQVLEPNVDAVKASKEQQQRAITIPGVIMSFEISKAAILRDSLECLGDQDLNPEVEGVVKATTDNGFLIEVRNNHTGVAATVILHTPKLTNFQCTQPLPPHMINLMYILEFFEDNPDDDPLFISWTKTLHDHRSRLSFKSGTEMPNDPACQLNVTLVPLEHDPEWFPANTKVMAFATISSKFLGELIEYLEQATENQQVLIVVKYGLVEMFVGQEDDWKSLGQFKCDPKGQTRGIQYDAYFNWPHTESLKKALSLSLDHQEPVIYFLSEPEKHIMMRFDLEGHGDLTFITKAARLHRKIKIPVKKDSVGGHAVEHPQPGIGAAAEPSRPSGDAAEASQLLQPE